MEVNGVSGHGPAGSANDTRRRRQRWWTRLGLPLKVGILFGLLGALFAVIGLVRGASEPFSWRGMAMAILLAGGSWGLVSWALTTAISEAAQCGAADGGQQEDH